MRDLLFLVHRIPYPPNKGDKIRSFNILRHLAQHWRIHLGAFVDDAGDWQYVDALREYCVELHLRPLRPLQARLRSIAGFWQGEPLTVPYYHDSSMRAWVEDMRLRSGLDTVLVFSSAMAQYVIDGRWSSRRRVIDFVDVDSDKWRQYAQASRGPMGWVYRREASTLLEFERMVAARFDASAFVSAREAALFHGLAPESEGKITYFSNGVDLDYFDPDASYADPYQKDARIVVFTGAMDYWANVNAVEWFAHAIWPRIRQALPTAEFYIVGSRPTQRVQALGGLAGVHVTGSVADIRPYLAHAQVAVAPMRIARGVQNKVLEAMAMAIPVVTTTAGFEGIEADVGQDLLVRDDAEGFAAEVIELFRSDRREQIRQAGRRCVERNYSWDAALARLDGLLDADKPGMAEVVGI